MNIAPGLKTASQVKPEPPKAEPRPNPSEPDRPQHDPGFLRDTVEKTGGVVSAALRVPRSLISGTALGGYHGRKRGLDAEVTTPIKELALQMYVGNAIQSTAVGAVGALVVGGPGAAAASVAKDVAWTGAKVAVYKKFGKPGSMSRRMAASIDRRVEGGEGALKGTAKGAFAGGTSAAAGGAIIGFREGRGTTSGLIEGFSEIDDEIKEAAKPSGGPLRKIAASAGAGVNGLLSAPAGLIQGLTQRQGPTTRQSRDRQILTTVASGAVVGGAAGLLGGPLGAAIGAGVGAVTGLVSSAFNDEFVTEVGESLERAGKNDTDMGDEETNARRDLVQNAIVGTVAGVRTGWDTVVGAVSGD